jgi:hypothetical protein
LPFGLLTWSKAWVYEGLKVRARSAQPDARDKGKPCTLPSGVRNVARERPSQGSSLDGQLMPNDFTAVHASTSACHPVSRWLHPCRPSGMETGLMINLGIRDGRLLFRVAKHAIDEARQCGATKSRSRLWSWKHVSYVWLFRSKPSDPTPRYS